MIDRERHELILTHLRKRRFVTVRELTALLSASEATIRRDLLHMEKAGEIQRHWGGASLTESSRKQFQPPFLPESPLAQRIGKLSDIKRLIAQKAASLIDEGETIIIDGGSTTWFMTEFLEDKNLRIITNSFAIAARLIDTSQNTIIIPGGIIYPESRIVINPFDSDFFNGYTPSKLFMSVAGLSANGATNSETTLIRLEKRMIASADELIVLCDSSKLMKRDSLFLCDLESIDTLITDQGISAPFKSTLEKAGVRVLVVEG